MSVFFFVVGLEIKRETTEGELRDARRAALPVIAALGGMVLPALLYVVINIGEPTMHGWGIPMATDIALALGVLLLVGRRLPLSVKTFLLTLAIVDDIGAIIAIALFYSSYSPDLLMLAVASVLLLSIPLLRRAGALWAPLSLVVGLAVWAAIHASGIHATIAGVLLALVTPSHPIRNPEYVDAGRLSDVSDYSAAKETVVLARQSVSSVEWLEHLLHPWSSYLILPLFALANAGVDLSAPAVRDALSSSVTLGVIVGLLVGKTIGVVVFAWVALKVRVGRLPTEMRVSHLAGTGVVAGIGFTVALFIADLAFDDPALASQAKIGVLAASIIAAVTGLALLRAIDVRQSRAAPQK